MASSSRCRLALLPLILACGDSDQSTAGAASTSSSTGEGAHAGTGAAGAAGPRAVGGGGSGGNGDVPSPFDCAPPTGPLPAITTEVVVDGLIEPVGIVAPPSDVSRLFILEKAGTIRIINDGVLLPEPFLDLSPVVWHEGEAGLLSLAFHPSYAENGRFFVYYTIDDPNGAWVAEFRRSDADPDVADPAIVGGVPLLATTRSFIHLGGTLAFSPVDGYLYLSLGERGSGSLAQDTGSWLGKILRVDVSTAPYSIPLGNWASGLPEIWDVGLRNPWRMSFDLCTGDLYIGDVGEFLREEVNVEPPGQGLRNYGWPIMEGTACNPEPCDPSGLTLPVIDHPHDVADPFDVVIGGVVYRGNAIPALRGAYVYASTAGGIYSFRYSSGLLSDAQKLSASPGVTVSVGQDAEGEVYFAQLDGGAVHRLVAR